ncbi:PTS fructose transporter subunit IIC [Alkalithermobacter paradoxus]|uniref:PTS system fructose-specific EIIBC component n=1 Tax=Alkalithermobacter paradoxus TaxID=29349 RepID=A0A1V4IA61_9FIRM|nr:PTS system fructose-specific EIIBC component [[Clostridium] thermoalcaliphilum]
MKILAVTACPTGIAHTYMAAEALQIGAKELGVDIKVETRGSVGAENEITNDDIKNAHAVILAVDTNVDKERFGDLPTIEVSVKDAIKDPKGLINRAISLEKKSYSNKVLENKNEEKEKRTGAYKHLMTGVSFMIPFVVAGGILIALSFAFGIEAFREEGTLAAALMQIGGAGAFALMVPILSGYIAYSIADRPGLVPGMVGGMIAGQIGAGFLGGIIAGFGAGYIILFLKKYIKLPREMEGLMPVLILPVLSSLIIGLSLIFVVGGPVATINKGIETFLNTLSSGSAVGLGAVLGLMMAFDMGGPINKAAYAFAVGTISAGQPSMVMAAVMAAGMTPPIGIALATSLAKNKFTVEEKEAGKAAFFLGISFITEGAIPFAASDPIRIIPSLMAGSAVAGALSMAFKCTLAVPHGGIFVLPIPNAVGGLMLYTISILIGSIVTGVLIATLKRK